MDVRGEDLVAEFAEAFEDALGDDDGVRALALGDRDRHGRVVGPVEEVRRDRFAARDGARRRTEADLRVGLGVARPVGDARHVGDAHRVAVVDADDQRGDFGGASEIRADLDRNLAVVCDEAPDA